MAIAVAMVGTGGWAREALAPALRAVPDVVIVACASPDLPQARQFAEAMGIARVYPGVEELLAAESGLDLLVVATPDSHHPLAVRCAAQAGVAVYCEKPLASSAGDADLLLQDVERAAIPATVGFSFRYSYAVQELRRDLRAGLLGTPWLIEMHEHNPQFHPATGRPLTWKGDPRYAGGGAIFEYGAHIVDLGYWLLGPASEVTASYVTVIDGGTLDDIAAVQLRYGPGVLGTLVASWVLPGGFPGIRLRLHGSEGTADVLLGERADGTERYTRYTPSGVLIRDADLTPGQPDRAIYTKRHVNDFLTLIGGGEVQFPDTMPTVKGAVHVQHVLDTALRATERHLPVPSK